MPEVFKRTFTEEQRKNMALEVLETGSNVLIARKYDLHENLLSRWVCNYRRYQQTLEPKKKKEKEIIPNYKKEYEKLKKEFEEKELENKILKDLLKKKNLQ